MLKVGLSLFFVLVLITLHAQDRCGTVEYEKLRALRNPNLETKDQFESWIRNKLAKRSPTTRAQRVEGASYQVPVVVHIIHNGETLGTGTNISDAQILSQIPVLNNDFQRLNDDAASTPAEFLGVAGAFPVTFVMAKQDPDGLPTNGIVRVKGSQTTWDIEDNYTLKAQSYWPAEDYLNIWVVNLTGGLLGYTQLPVSSTLQGLNDSSNDRLTDGVVIDYTAFGKGSGFNLQKDYDLGRTTTHEVGHFFGLRHVWGDVNSCDPLVSTDYVSDTPIQNSDFNGLCPSTPQTECNVHAMYSNYMNYTNDACMNIFSVGQGARMDVIINNSPRRATLLASPGLQDPAPVANDLGIKSILTPGTTACSGSLIPSIRIRNYGTNTVTDTQIQFSINGVLTETNTFSSINIISNAEETVSFASVLATEGATYNFSFKIVQTNGGTDGNNKNDSLATNTQVPVSASLPMQEQFTTMPSGKPVGWQITNPDGLTTWSKPPSLQGMYLNFYDYDQQGSTDLLITPVLDLTTAAVASLNFDYAYAQYLGGSTDELRVLVSTVCDFNTSPVVIFDKRGSSLATASPTSGSFIPTSSSQWATSIISLNQFIGQKIQIAFEGINGWGNNLYLDNVTVTNSTFIGLTLKELVQPSPVSCNATQAPVIKVSNLGNAAINSFTANVYINNQLTVEKISGIQLAIGATANFTLSNASFQSGVNTLAIALKDPNGIPSGAISGDSLHTALVINTTADKIPLRENFDDDFSERWTMVNPSLGTNWVSSVTNKSNSMLFPAFGNADLGQQAWLVSPVLDFSQAQTASFNFESSYAYNANGIETLRVYTSSDCGVTFDSLVFNSSGEMLSNATSATAWVPSDDNQWTKNPVPLNHVAGKKNIRIAFVATNGNGNNLYIDDIEFFTDDVQPHPIIADQYTVYGGAGNPVKVTFNLPEKELVRMQVYDMLGHVVSDNLLPDTLNQTYTIDFPQESRGLYVIRVQTATSIGATKVLMGF